MNITPCAVDALSQLRDGNRRFVKALGASSNISISLSKSMGESDQHPFAVVLGCSDSRVPAEIVFNQGPGDLFVIRVAGNIVAPSQIGSIEFACQHFATPLVLVMGHTRCGAISATVDSLTGHPNAVSPNFATIIDRVVPAVHQTVMDNRDAPREDLLTLAGRANIQESVRSLHMRSRILAKLVEDESLQIIGAEYSVETGQVKFFD